MSDETSVGGEEVSMILVDGDINDHPPPGYKTICRHLQVTQ